MQDEDNAPDGQPKTKSAEGKCEVEGMARPPAVKDPRQMAGAAQHDAVLVVIGGDERLLLDTGRLIGYVRFPDGVFFHGATVRGSRACGKRRRKK